jgi:hypothetical protein
LTPDDARRWLPTVVFALDLVRIEMLPPLDALVDDGGTTSGAAE